MPGGAVDSANDMDNRLLSATETEIAWHCLHERGYGRHVFVFFHLDIRSYIGGAFF